ncbi:liver-expressed antimicrobial peptide 2 isoform X2 [Gasterosteus aculeatus]|uniref:liver-expressed antimicrobial peptide 2 isoform X2 n=1 Tax=Gasterosteus aculeatus aculeatus TaxID=481459 RepID=UPI001A98A599|nr:liver-expressed antimicrobial peptide 2 isoform X2 [Gasterosteus aculeatus aculeatus]
MQGKGFFVPSGTAAVLCVVLLLMAQQALAGALAPRPRPGVAPGAEWNVPVPRRVARMTPLWRIMNSKPLGAYCQNNYECSTGLCRAGHCSTIQRSITGPVNY